MNCEQFWESYPELGLSPEARGHAAGCESCARLLSEHDALAAGLRVASAEWKRTEAPDRVEQGLLAAFRVQQSYGARRQRIPWLPVLSWAAAAAALIVLAMLTIHKAQPVAPMHPPSRSVEWAAVPATGDLGIDDDSAADDFIPLPNAEQVGDNEDVNVVRVEVPRSAMLSVGLPVNPDQATEMVEADVVLGSDGLARAVRFVNG